MQRPQIKHPNCTAKKAGQAYAAGVPAILRRRAAIMAPCRCWSFPPSPDARSFRSYCAGPSYSLDWNGRRPGGGMADAEDLKSSGDFSSCGFDSHPGHHKFPSSCCWRDATQGAECRAMIATRLADFETPASFVQASCRNPNYTSSWPETLRSNTQIGLRGHSGSAAWKLWTTTPHRTIQSPPPLHRVLPTAGVSSAIG